MNFQSLGWGQKPSLDFQSSSLFLRVSAGRGAGSISLGAPARPRRKFRASPRDLILIMISPEVESTMFKR